VVGSRDLLMEFVRRDIRIRYKQAVMGFLWAIFMPLVVVLSGLVVRLVLSQFGDAQIDRAVIGGLAVKAVPWGFFVGGLGMATNSLVTNSNLLTKVYFPREVLPLSALMAQGFDTAVAALGVILLAPFLSATLSFALLWVPVLALLLFGFTLALGLAVSCANVFFRDVRYIVQVLLTFGIFFTPVFFEPEMMGDLGGQLIMLNPIAPLVEGFRLSVIDGANLLDVLTARVGGTTTVVWHPMYLLYSTAWTVVGLAVATKLFRSGMASFAEYA